MKHTLIEFKDFEYVENGVLPSEKMRIIVNVKVLDKSDNYLGSLNFGIYEDIEGEDLKYFIIHLVSEKFPSYKKYTKTITKLKN